MRLDELHLAASDIERLKVVLPALFQQAEADITDAWKFAVDPGEREGHWNELRALERLRASWEELSATISET